MLVIEIVPEWNETTVLWLLVVVGVANVLCFLLYGWDKWAAVRGRWRVPEKTLLLASLPRTALGAWSAVSVFRHKSSKRSYRLKLLGVTFGASITADLADPASVEPGAPLETSEESKWVVRSVGK